MRKLLSIIFIITGLIFASSSMPAKAETTECTEIVSLPAVITVQGVYCFKQNLTTAITSGNAIDIQTNNVTIDLNSWKLGGSTAGVGTSARGIHALNRKNITIRNGTIRGFSRAIHLELEGGGPSSGHLIEDIRADGNRGSGFIVSGDNIIIRNNHVINTGDSSVLSSASGIIVGDGSNAVVTGNVVDGVSETFSVHGIFGSALSTGEFTGNTVFGLNTATTRNGVHFVDVTNVTVLKNRLINSSGGTTAIDGSQAGTIGVDCIENVVRGYTTGQSGCDYLSGNHIN